MKEKFYENTDTLSRNSNMLMSVLDLSKMKSKLRQGIFDRFIYIIFYVLSANFSIEVPHLLYAICLDYSIGLYLQVQQVADIWYWIMQALVFGIFE